MSTHDTPTPSPAPVAEPAPAPSVEVRKAQALEDQAKAMDQQATQTAYLADAYRDLLLRESGPKPDHEVWLAALLARTTGSNAQSGIVAFADSVLALYKQRFKP